MQIQKGIVKYKDRSDIICTYGLTDDGKQYYFLDGNTTSNGNIVATTVLVEAIDPLVGASSIGLIDPNGNVVIPFENKLIKVLNDNLLLVEKANSTTPSVVEANQLRSDPLAATRLVTTPATIKEKMNAKMGSDGRFVFNDQFSEATICDVNGNNLINGEFYSFIGIKNDGTLYLSKNVVDSPIMEFSSSNGLVVENANEEANTVETNTLGTLDISNTDVNQEVIDSAMSANENVGFGIDDITAKDFEAMSSSDSVTDVIDGANDDSSIVSEETESVPAGTFEEKLSDEEIETEVSEGEQSETEDNNISDDLDLNIPLVNGGASDEGLEIASGDDQDGVIPENVEDNSDSNNDQIPVEIKEVSVVEDEVKTAALQEEVVEDENSNDSVVEVVEDSEEITSDSVGDEKKISDELVSFDFGDNINYDSEERELSTTSSFSSDIEYRNSLFDSDLDNDIFADSKLHVDKIISDYGMDYTSGSKDTIIEDVASTMSNLINLNRSQRQKIVAYEEKIDEMVAVHKRVVEKARSQVRDIDNLKNKLKNYENVVAKLEAKVQLLETKVYDQERLIANQANELEALRPQIEGKKELVKILADAQVLLDQAA